MRGEEELECEREKKRELTQNLVLPKAPKQYFSLTPKPLVYSKR